MPASSGVERTSSACTRRSWFFLRSSSGRRARYGAVMARKNTKDPFIIVTKNFVVTDKPGRKYMEKMLQDGFEVTNEMKTVPSRVSTVTFRKPNPDYVAP